VWERWDALGPDGSIHSGEMGRGDGPGMLSFNHYAYGAVVDWIYRYVAGIAPTPEHPGYRHIIVAPRPATTIDWARATVETRLGTVSIDWALRGATLEVDLLVPYGSRAQLDLPTTDRSEIELNGTPFDGAMIGPGRHRIRVTNTRIANAGTTR
jgi:alpha-L-rhamnosidase